MSWPPSKKPDWMKEDDPNFCTKHQCQKTPMITSSFCPKCQAEVDLQNTPAEDNFNFGSEITVPDFKIIKCIYCATHCLHPIGFDPSQMYKCLNVTPADQQLKVCTCTINYAPHKLNMATGFYQCQRCLNYSLEVNSK